MTESAQDLTTRLAAVPVFTGLSSRHLGKLVDASRVTTHQAGHEIAKEGEGALALHVILDGTAEVAVHGRATRELGPGDYFGEISLIDGKKRSASVTAATDSHTLAVPHLACLPEAARERARLRGRPAHAAVRPAPRGRGRLTTPLTAVRTPARAPRGGGPPVLAGSRDDR